MEKKLPYSRLPPDYTDVPILITDHKPSSPKPQKRSSGSRRCCALTSFLISLVFISAGIYLIFHTYHFYRQPDLYPTQRDGLQFVIKFIYPEDLDSHNVENLPTLSFDPSWYDDPFEHIEPELEPEGMRGDSKCTVSMADKVDCFPGGGSDKDNCEAKGCCWVPVIPAVSDTPWCFYPADNSIGYKLDEIHVTHMGYEALYTRNDTSRWPSDIMKIQMDTYEESASRFHFKIFDQKNDRFEPPIDTPLPNPSTRPSKPEYKQTIAKDGFGIKVTRADSPDSVLFDTTGTKLTFADQYIEISTSLPTNYIYGLGEHRDRLLHDVKKGFSMSTWARDQPPAGCVNCNLYGQHPFFIGLEDKTGEAYGVFLLNANAMEILASPASSSKPGQPAMLTYKTVGGILDFYVFTGPTPSDVVMQYLEVVGMPYMPPYWGLGYHLCRWGYKSSDNMKAVIKRMRDYGFPYDTQWNDIDYMNKHYDWTYDADKFKDLPAIVKDLHDHGQHYIMIVDPGIANVSGYSVYDEGLKEGVFIMHADKDEPIIGKVWPGYTAYPDFFSDAAKKWWLKQATAYHQTVPYDGMWTDMNEPSNFVDGSTEGCTKSKYDNPPFTPAILGGSLIQKTICPSGRHKSGVHYDLHSMYGHSELIASQEALHTIRAGKRTVVISRSTFPSSGKYAGHWTGDNAASWDDLRYSIPGILNFQFFGIPFVGADICGFMGTTNPELCVRWTQLGAFYPFMRNHNTLGSADQDPAAPMFQDVHKKAMKRILTARYTLLPILYTLLARAHMNGTTVARPLWFEYPKDAMTYANDAQFMWGESMLIAPVLKQGATSLDVYFPEDTWIDIDDGTVTKSTGESKSVKAPLDKIPVYIRAGAVLPMQMPDVTTTASRKNPFNLYVTLDDTKQACGSLYWDDGESLNATESGMYNHLYFTVKDGTLMSTVDHSGYNGTMVLNTVKVTNSKDAITSATVNGKPAKVSKSVETYVIAFDAVDFTKPVTLTWK